MSRRRPAVTMLDAFCLANKIRTEQLANAAGVSRQQIGRLRYAKADARIGFAKLVARGVSKLVRRKTPIGELFDLDFDYP